MVRFHFGLKDGENQIFMNFILAKRERKVKESGTEFVLLIQIFQKSARKMVLTRRNALFGGAGRSVECDL